MSKQLKQVSRDEITKHNKPGDLWIVIDSKVFDVSKFAALHPGGESVLLDEEVAGQDATDAFFGLHRYEILEKPNYARLQIGVVQGEIPKITSTRSGMFSTIPYGEPTWLSSGFHSPYYKESHRKFQAVMRKFVNDIVYPDAQAREEDGKPPAQSVLDAMAAVNLHAMRLGPGKHLKGKVLFDGLVSPEEFDYFHELIITQELARTRSRGYGDGLLGGMVIGLPPVLNFGSAELQARIVPEVFAGKKIISLAISEAFAGSDVMGMKTTATLSKDGTHYIVNGTKKWITNGTFSDYFTVGCRTESGFSVLLIERGEGVETKPIKTSYSATAGTAYVTFDNVKVPVGNMLGPDGGGIFVMLSNFNHERWVMCCSSIRSHRSAVEECMAWANQRHVFGKPLNAQAVVRNKLAAMIAQVESLQAWLENVTYQMNNMSYKQQASKLAGQIAFLKMAATQSAQSTARDAVQLFGGRGITQTGMGKYIEHYHRCIVFDSLLGGAEDVLGDLGVRQAMRAMPKNVRL